MRPVHTLLLSAATVFAALAFAASAAFAQAPIEFLNEETMEPCDPCIVHLLSEERTGLALHGLGLESSPTGLCFEEFEAEIWHDAESGAPIGHVYGFETDHGIAVPCAAVPCTDASEGEWPIPPPNETSPGSAQVHMEMCMRPENGLDYHVSFDMEIAAVLGHVTEFWTQDGDAEIEELGPFFTGEYTGHWAVEADSHDGLFIQHL